MTSPDEEDLKETAELPKKDIGSDNSIESSTAIKINYDDLVGKKLGRYKIESCLGKGSMGVVYLARESFLKRYVAIKVLSPHLTKSRDSLVKFKREARLLAMLNHPNITGIYLFEEQDGMYYFVFEFVRGDTLEKYLEKKGRLPIRDTSKIIIEILKALHHAHKLGVIHRDIKPSNVMLDSVGRVKVTDFGLAAQSKFYLEGTDIISGTPHYISPEQIKGDSISPATDLYSTGILFYQILTGELPFKAKKVEEIFNLHLDKMIPSVSNSVRTIPLKIEKIIRKMTEKDPDKRYQSAKEVILELEEFKSGKSSSKSKSSSSKDEIKFEVSSEVFSSEYDDKDVALIRVFGSLEATTMEKVTNYIKKALNKNIYRLVLDFEKLTYINSSGMSMFLPFVEQVRSKAGDIIFIKTSDKIFKVFEMLGLHNIYIFHSTINGALKEFAKLVDGDESVEVKIFPFSYQCTSCSRFFKIPSQGKYTCPYCTAGFIVSMEGMVKSEKRTVKRPYIFKLPGSASSLSLIRGALRGLLSTLEFDDEDEYQIIQAVDEACANVIAYASKGDSNFEFEIIIFTTSKKIEIHILDKGESFNPLAQKAVDVNKRFAKQKVGGIGLELIKRCMTTVDYVPLKGGGNKLILIKESKQEVK
ncbi:MAG: hypothetical protein COA79_24020 [Planctomycetota bacterium]|nr:MAG: hypothetical protein COA79_24020 [Planctomycetota bacterium]